MAADQPTILATSGGVRQGVRKRLGFDRLLHHAAELSGVAGRPPRGTHPGTASGDQRWFNAEMDDGVGPVYHGTKLVEALTETRGKGAYIVTGEADEDGGTAASEQRLEPRSLG